MRFTKAGRATRDRRICALYQDGQTAVEIAARGDIDLSADGVLKVLARSGIDRRAPGPQPGEGSAAPAPATGTKCPQCRKVARDLQEIQCSRCGYQFWVTSHRPTALPTMTRFFELDHHGFPVQTSGPLDDDDDY